ncbi:MAG: type III secretion system chaperone [Desulfovibrionaceae bacterium]|nr:type III secretion system chaperone [Desulfovibrionaceae bacterium]
MQSLSEAEGEELTFDEQGDCALVSVENRLTHIHYDAEHYELQFYGIIGQLPADEALSDKMIFYFMSNNFMWVNSFGATFALDPENKHVILQKRYQEFEELNQDFKGIAAGFDYELGYWKNIFDNLPDEIDEAEVEI